MKEEEKQLRRYVSHVIQEALSDYYSLTDLPTQIKNVKSKFRKIKDFFTGDVSNLADDIVNEIEEKYDVELPDEIKENITAFVKEKFPVILDKAKNNKSKAKEKIKAAVSYRFGNQIRAWIRAYEEDDDDDDDDDDYSRNPSRRVDRRKIQPQRSPENKGKQKPK